ncbi:hypothetical protein HPB50_021110 [Hyalomma asiaticum]|uniref:Uncharacterized protein n=1 Tax=Hyalomma asiaticum TaxID=266040 RepID=A0ACB7T3V2_HYAAI|nr:hypothetical protein HPB50_021110 [Hyalomma asiaticum]
MPGASLSVSTTSENFSRTSIASDGTSDRALRNLDEGSIVSFSVEINRIWEQGVGPEPPSLNFRGAVTLLLQEISFQGLNVIHDLGRRKLNRSFSLFATVVF